MTSCSAPHLASSLALIAALGLGTSGCLRFHAAAPEGAPEDATFAQLRDTEIHYVDEGPQDGSAVVLIHGFASSVGVWESIRETLAERGKRVLALDLKGFGQSGRPEGDYSPEEQARLVLALMDARGVEQAALVAHSYGTSVAFQVALIAPERVSRIAVYDGWAYAEQLPTTFHWARARGVGEAIFGAFYDQRAEDKVALGFHDPENVPQALVDTVEAQLARPGTDAAALAAVRAMRYAEVQTRYPEIDVPVLLLWGREDTITPLRFGERLRNELPQASLEVFPLCGHFPMIEARRPSTASLVRFLEDGANDTSRAALGQAADDVGDADAVDAVGADAVGVDADVGEAEGPGADEGDQADPAADPATVDQSQPVEEPGRPWYEQGGAP